MTAVYKTPVPLVSLVDTGMQRAACQMADPVARVTHVLPGFPGSLRDSVAGVPKFDMTQAESTSGMA